MLYRKHIVKIVSFINKKLKALRPLGININISIHPLTLKSWRLFYKSPTNGCIYVGNAKLLAARLSINLSQARRLHQFFNQYSWYYKDKKKQIDWYRVELHVQSSAKDGLIASKVLIEFMRLVQKKYPREEYLFGERKVRKLIISKNGYKNAYNRNNLYKKTFITEYLNKTNLTQKSFADLIDVYPTHVSHVLAGRRPYVSSHINLNQTA